MPNFEEMYFALAAKVADVIEMLIAAQLEGEEAYTKNAPDADDPKSKTL